MKIKMLNANEGKSIRFNKTACEFAELNKYTHVDIEIKGNKFEGKFITETVDENDIEKDENEDSK